MPLSKRATALAILLVLPLFLILGPKKQRLESAALTSVKDTLSTSQLSYFGRLASGNTAGNSNIIIGFTAPSTTTTNLFVGDTLSIGRTGTDTRLDTYTVLDIPSSNTIELRSGIGASNALIENAVIATRSAVHTVTFTPASLNTGGKFQVLLKATDTSLAKAADGIPDQDGFDLGQDVTGLGGTTVGTVIKLADVTCPSLGAGTSASAVGTTTISSTNYLYFDCPVAVGTQNNTTPYTITIGSTLASGAVSSQVINPSASTSHTYGQAGGVYDIYSFYVRHQNTSGTILDSTHGKIAVIEAVRVTASVDPSITFTIDNIKTGAGSTPIGVGDTVCGVPMSDGQSSVTATAVPFGSLSLAMFNNLSQRLSCVTNGPWGYVVTAREVGSLTTIGAGSSTTTIPDTKCDNPGGDPCTASSTKVWVSDVGTTNSGFGYSLENISATNIGTTYISAANWQGRPFSKIVGSPVNIIWNTVNPTATERAYVCYRLAITTTQPAGTYENEIIYVATATF